MNSKNNKRCVLVVDDQENWRDLLTEVLEDDLKVTKVATLKEAWAAVLQKKDPPFHVVVTDIRLNDDQAGNEDGMNLAEMLNRLGDATKVIVVTGFPTLSTVKRAMGPLKVYDYLEKAPENGTTFNADEFHDKVCRAAEEAERARPAGFTLPRLWVLLIGGETAWRDKLEGLLKDRLYDVDVLPNFDHLAKFLKKEDKKYQLVIFHESVSKEQAEFYSILQHDLPEVKKIMFTDQDIEPVVRLIQEQEIINVFTVRDGQFNRPVFDESLHRAFAPEATRYAVANIYDSDFPEQELSETEALISGHKYRLVLTLQDARDSGGVAVWLVPKAEKRGKVQFKVFVYTPNMVFRPDSETYWEIPVSRQIRPLITEIIPQVPGKTTMTIDLEQDNGWAWRLTRTVIVK